MTTVTFPSDLLKESVLIELWNHTRALGMGALHSHQQPTVEDAKEELEKNQYIDYFFGKPIKTDFANYPILESRLYDRDAGSGTMQAVADSTAKYVGKTEKLTKEEQEDLEKKCAESITVANLPVENT